MSSSSANRINSSSRWFSNIGLEGVITTIARFWYCKNGTVLSDVETAPAKLDFVHLVVLQKRTTRSQEEVRLTQFIFCRGGLLLSKSDQNLFKWRHSHSEVILLCVCWYLRYALSYRDLEEMMKERNLTVDHTTIYLRR